LVKAASVPSILAHRRFPGGLGSGASHSRTVPSSEPLASQRPSCAFAPESLEEIPGYLSRESRPGDVLLLMSSGAFGGLPEKLLEML
jgi:UDP-N-acetylmuramate-alanine ligase